MPGLCNHCRRVLSAPDDTTDLPLFCPFCGGRTRSPAEAEATAALENTTIPTAISRYRSLRLLGRGGMGDVYEALDTVSGGRVAVKYLAERLADDPASVELFRNEGRLAQKLANPHCVTVLATEEVSGRPFIVMELMPGRTLKDVVDEAGPLPPQQAIGFILDIVEGLSEAHRLGIVHRDVKPSNCFLTEDQRVKVGDFGLSRAYSERPHSNMTGFSGTVLFASPEQIRGEEVDFDSDIYSVCATLYYLLGGRAPHQAESVTAALAKAISQEPPRLRSIRLAVPAELERIVMKGLNRDRAKRWTSLDELAHALRKAKSGRSGCLSAVGVAGMLIWLACA